MCMDGHHACIMGILFYTTIFVESIVFSSKYPLRINSQITIQHNSYCLTMYSRNLVNKLTQPSKMKQNLSSNISNNSATENKYHDT